MQGAVPPQFHQCISNRKQAWIFNKERKQGSWEPGSYTTEGKTAKQLQERTLRLIPSPSSKPPRQILQKVHRSGGINYFSAHLKPILCL